MNPTIHADHALAQRLEGAEGSGNAAFVEARARVAPGVGATWIEVAGAKALFDGAGSPCTQAFGLGMFDEVEAAHLDRVESFFFERQADCDLEVCTLAPPAFHGMLARRGYSPVELSHVMVRPLVDPPPPSPPGIDVREMGPAEGHAWAALAAEGWSDVAPQLLDFIRDLGRVNAARHDTVCYFAEQSGTPIAAGALCITGDVALLAGASTVPHARRRGAQAALLATRLAWAAESGCDVAMVVTQPGSASQRNAERNGFRVAYGRVKWHRAYG